MTKVHPIIAGSNAPLSLTFLDAASDQAVNLTGCTGFSAIAKNTETGVSVSMESVIVTDAAQGKIKVEWAVNAFIPGLFSLQVACTDATGSMRQHAPGRRNPQNELRALAKATPPRAWRRQLSRFNAMTRGFA